MAFILATDFDFIAYMSTMAFFWKLFSRQWRFWNMIPYAALHLPVGGRTESSRSAQRVKDPGPRSVGNNDGDCPARLATTTTVRAFPRWPATSMTTRRGAQLINAVSKLGEHTWPTRFVGRGPSKIAKQEQSLSAYLDLVKLSGCFCLMVSTVLPRCLHPALYGLFFLFHNGQAWLRCPASKVFCRHLGQGQFWGHLMTAVGHDCI